MHAILHGTWLLNCVTASREQTVHDSLHRDSDRLIFVCVCLCVFPLGVKRMVDEGGGRKLGDEEVHGRLQCYLSSHTGGTESGEVEDEKKRDRGTLGGFVDRVPSGMQDLRDWERREGEMKGKKKSMEACPLEPAYQLAFSRRGGGRRRARAGEKKKGEAERKRVRMSQGAGRRWKIAARMNGAKVKKGRGSVTEIRE